MKRAFSSRRGRCALRFMRAQRVLHGAGAPLHVCEANASLTKQCIYAILKPKGGGDMKKIISILFLAFNILSFSGCEKVPAPQITKGEFPFEITYEIDGEIITVSDVYICEFDGFDWNEGVGKYRKWKGYIKSSGAEELILLEDGDLKFAVSIGSPEYYMGDPSCPYSENTPSVYYIKPNELGGTSLGIESLLEQYKIKLISWAFSEPIENSFE